MKTINYYHERSPKSFEEKLDDILLTLEAKFRYSSQDFGINFSDGNSILLQIVRRSMLDTVKDKEFGFGIYLSFDETFSMDKEELKRFQKSAFKDLFEHHIWEGVSCYQLDVRNDKNRIKSISGTILEVVYLKGLSRIEIEACEM